MVVIQDTKIDSSIAISVLFPESCEYSVYRKDRKRHGGGVMLLVHKDIEHIMLIAELDNMGLVARKPVFGISNKVRFKQACSATETS